jgi:glycerophosphoryl diester phosphodiesterase
VLRALARPGLVTALHLERRQTSPDEVAGYLARGLRVGVWTVNDPREATDLVSLGVESIITDQPAAIVTGLRRRT